MPSSFLKGSADILDYTIDWSLWLETGDTVVASSWAVPSGIVKNSESFTVTQSTIWLIGGYPGASYTLVNTITTSNGQQKAVSIVITIQP